MSEQEQLSIFSESPPLMDEPSESAAPLHYEPLDHQLAQLMQQLNGADHAVLNHCTLQISQHTREGNIAIACSSAQQAELIQTKVVGTAGDYQPLILDGAYLYLNRYWQYQQCLAQQLLTRMRLEQTEADEAGKSWAQEKLAAYFNEEIPTADSEPQEINGQRLAAERALSHRLLILSGGPGTGKTTTITRIIGLLIEQRLEQLNKQKSEKNAKRGCVFKVLLAAPTGKAAIRMLDSINQAKNTLKASPEVLEFMPQHATTIHKLLGFIPEKVHFKHHQQNPLDADVVLVDEASMIDIALMSKLIAAVPASAKLILIGDKDQLSSVETGSVFADICDALSTPPLSTEPAAEESPHKKMLAQHLVTLQKNWRFSKDSGIGQLAIASNRGDSQTVLSLLHDEAQPQCSLLSPKVLDQPRIPAELLIAWQDYFQTLSNPNASLTEIFNAFNQYRILCALRRGLNGSRFISQRIEETLHKQGLIQLGHAQNKRWYHGRPVMITQNSYSKGLFNGDTGITLERDGAVKVWFPDTQPDTFKSLAPVRLPAHETTWAMTIHKSQGSEFDEVTLILPHEEMPLLTRQLIYTGVTRAKQRVKIISDEKVLTAGIQSEVIKATRIEDVLADNH